MPTTIMITVTPHVGQSFEVEGTLTDQQTDWLVFALQRAVDRKPMPPVGELYANWIMQCHKDQWLRGRRYSQPDPGESEPWTISP